MIEPFLRPKNLESGFVEQMVKEALMMGFEKAIPVFRDNIPRKNFVKNLNLSGVEVFSGELKEKKEKLKIFDDSVNFVFANPGTQKEMKALSEQEGIDGFTGITGKAFLKEKALKKVSKNSIPLIFNFSPVINKKGRFFVLKRFFHNFKMCRETDCSILLTVGARDLLALRAPRELKALGMVSGMDLDQLEKQ